MRFQTARTEIGRDVEAGSSLKKTPRSVQYFPHWRSEWFMHDKRLFGVSRSLDSFNAGMQDPTYDGIGGEELTISCLGLSAEPIRQLINKCREIADSKAQFYVIIYSRDRFGMSWKPKYRKPLRRLETVHFDDRIKQGLLADIRNYLDPRTKKLYQSRSMPYRRGYLFYGPPGTGKSSLSTAIAGEFGLVRSQSPQHRQRRRPRADVPRNSASVHRTTGRHRRRLDRRQPRAAGDLQQR
jgi:chaperone BCS1